MRSALRTVALALAVAAAPACVVWDSRTQSGPPGSSRPPVREHPGSSEPEDPVVEAQGAEQESATSPVEGETEPAMDSPQLAGGEPAGAPPADELVAAAEIGALEAAEPLAPAEPVAASAPRAPAPLTFDSVLEATVEDGAGQPFARLDDLWADPASGVLVALVVAPLVAPMGNGGADERRILDPSCARWVAQAESVSVVLPQVNAEELERSLTGRATLFAARKSETVKGEVTAVEPDPECPLYTCIVQLRDDANLLHRVLVEPELVVRGLLPGLGVGRQALFRGVPTRDEAGKLWIAGAVEIDGRALALRDDTGHVAWRALARDLLSARALAESTARTSDGVEVELGGWRLDAQGMRLVEVLVRDGSLERPVAWSSLRRGAGGAWSLTLAQAELLALPDAAEAHPTASEPGDPRQ